MNRLSPVAFDKAVAPHERGAQDWGPASPLIKYLRKVGRAVARDEGAMKRSLTLVAVAIAEHSSRQRRPSAPRTRP